MFIYWLYSPDDDYDYDEDEENLWSIIGSATCVASFFQVAPISLVEGGHKTELSLSLWMEGGHKTELSLSLWVEGGHKTELSLSLSLWMECSHKTERHILSKSPSLINGGFDHWSPSAIKSDVVKYKEYHDEIGEWWWLWWWVLACL